MSIATFSEELKVFNVEDNYSTPTTASLSCKNQKHGRITWSGDGKWLAVAPLDKVGGPLPIFKYSNKQIQPLKYVNLSNITSASFFNWTNRNIAVGNEKGEVFVWDIKEKKVAVKVEYVESQPVDFIAVNSNDLYLASGSLISDKICLHGLKTNKVVNTITIPNSNHTSSLKFCMSKKNYLGVSSLESTVSVWDISRSEFVFKVTNSHSGACTDISFSPINFEVIASVSLTKSLKMYDLREKKLVLDEVVGEPLNCVDIIFNGDKVAMGTTGGSVIIFDLRASKQLCTFKAHQGPVLAVKTQNLKIPRSYQDVEMNTPEVVENQGSKTFNLSVIDVFSPISSTVGRDVSNGNYDQTLAQSTPKIFVTNSQSVYNYEDSFFKKVLSPFPESLIPTSQSSPYLQPISEKADSVTDQYDSVPVKQIKEEPQSQVYSFINAGGQGEEGGGGGGGGDGFNADNISQRNVYYSDLISEIKNCQKEVLNELGLIKKEMSEMKVEFDSRFKVLQQNYEKLNSFLMNDIKQGVYAANCDSKIEHISQRILINELNESMLASGDKLSEQISLNALRLKHIYEMLTGIK